MAVTQTVVRSRRRAPAKAMEILDLRHFGSAELRPLLTREAEVWEQRMHWDYRSASEMVLRYLDSKILPGYAAVQSGRVQGYSFFVYEGSKGVIGDVFADYNSRGLDLERRLLEHSIETLENSPGVRRIEAQLLLHDSGTLAGPFAGEGFDQYRRLFMSVPTSSLQPIALRGFQVREWVESDFQPASNLITLAYAGHIDAQINDQYRSAAGSLRFLNNIIRFPGCGFFDPYSSYVITEESSRSLAGLLLCSKVRDDTGHVTQVCVLPHFRGKGLARALLGHCAQSLAKRSFSRLTLTVTEGNTGAVQLYEKLGFTTERVFDAFVWEG